MVGIKIHNLFHYTGDRGSHRPHTVIFQEKNKKQKQASFHKIKTPSVK